MVGHLPFFDPGRSTAFLDAPPYSTLHHICRKMARITATGTLFSQVSPGGAKWSRAARAGTCGTRGASGSEPSGIRPSLEKDRDYVAAASVVEESGGKPFEESGR
jgi:hypothetical protein